MARYNYYSNISKFYIFSILGCFNFTLSVFYLFLQSNNLSMTQIMFLQSFFTLMIFLFEVPSGVLADIFGTKKTLILAEMISIISFVVYGFADNFYLFLFAEALMAIGIAGASGTDSSFIYDSLKAARKEKKYKSIYGNAATISMGTMGVFAVVSGFAAAALGYRPLFFLSAACFLLGTIPLFFAKEPVRRSKSEDTHYFAHMKEGVKFAYTHPKVRKYVLYYAFTGSLMYMMYVFMQPFYAANGLSVKVIGLGVACYFTFYALGSFFSDRISRFFKADDNLLMWVVGIAALFYVIIAKANVWIGFALISLVMLISSVKEIVVDHQIHQYTDSKHRATVLSVKNMGSRLVYTLFGPIAGYVADLYSIRTTILLMGLTLALVWVMSVLMFRKKDVVSQARGTQKI
jgi:MFS family permease